MAPDEGVVFVVSGVLALASWWRWYHPLVSVRRLSAGRGGRTLLAATPVLAALALFWVLRTASSFDVRDSALYLSFYVVFGLGWIGVAAQLLPVLGLNARDDVVERGNGAAAPAIAGGVLGLTGCFAGGNVGDGPGWWVVLFSATLATTALAAVWYGFDRFSRIGDLVTIDRDPAAGLRLGALLAASGIILGRAVAGDWLSAAATLNDFARVAWPVLALAAAALLVERVARPTPDTPAPPVALYGIPPALAYLGGAVAYLVELGPPA